MRAQSFVLADNLLMQVKPIGRGRVEESCCLSSTRPRIQARRLVEPLFPHFPKVFEPTDELILLLALDLILA